MKKNSKQKQCNAEMQENKKRSEKKGRLFLAITVGSSSSSSSSSLSFLCNFDCIHLSVCLVSRKLFYRHWHVNERKKKCTRYDNYGLASGAMGSSWAFIPISRLAHTQHICICSLVHLNQVR